MYYVLCFIWPTANQKLIKEMGLGWEEKSGDEVVAEDGTNIVEVGGFVREKNDSEDDGHVTSEAYSASKME